MRVFLLVLLLVAIGAEPEIHCSDEQSYLVHVVVYPSGEFDVSDDDSAVVCVPSTDPTSSPTTLQSTVATTQTTQETTLATTAATTPATTIATTAATTPATTLATTVATTPATTIATTAATTPATTLATTVATTPATTIATTVATTPATTIATTAATTPATTLATTVATTKATTVATTAATTVATCPVCNGNANSPLTYCLAGVTGHTTCRSWPIEGAVCGACPSRAQKIPLIRKKEKSHDKQPKTLVAPILSVCLTDADCILYPSNKDSHRSVRKRSNDVGEHRDVAGLQLSVVPSVHPAAIANVTAFLYDRDCGVAPVSFNYTYTNGSGFMLPNPTQIAVFDISMAVCYSPQIAIFPAVNHTCGMALTAASRVVSQDIDLTSINGVDACKHIQFATLSASISIASQDRNTPVFTVPSSVDVFELHDVQITAEGGELRLIDGLHANAVLNMSNFVLENIFIEDVNGG